MHTPPQQIRCADGNRDGIVGARDGQLAQTFAALFDAEHFADVGD